MMRWTLFAIGMLVFQAAAFAQFYLDVDYSVKVEAEVSNDPARITVKWINDPRTLGYDLYRRPYGVNGWGEVLASFSATEGQYIDPNVVPDQLYEYKITKSVEGGLTGYGYVLTGINVRPRHRSGELMILLTNTTQEQITTELNQFQTVLESDGWLTQVLTIDSAASVSQIKSNLVAAHADFPFTVLLILGDVPIPHSGNVTIDGHNNHRGAWSADLYYGDLDGIWTDTLVNSSISANPRNHNVPGDENWDQDFLPSDVEVAVGRVDFSELPAFPEDEYELLRRYLQKDIAFRTENVVTRRRAAMRNRNQWVGALGQNGIRNFSPLVTADSIEYDEWTPVFHQPYLWFYGGGAGTYTSATALGNTPLYSNLDFQAIFTAWFGSYFGDYDYEDNLLRAILGSGRTLTAVYAGAPHWFFHTMGMGFPVAHATTLTQNNDTTYFSGLFARSIHVNLLGDPTVKGYNVKPPTELVATENDFTIGLDWRASPDPTIANYYVYRRSDNRQHFTLIDSTAASVTTYTDACPSRGNTYQYLVRASKLETTPSGSFYNLSVGTITSITAIQQLDVRADFSAEVTDSLLVLSNRSENATSIEWLLPNGQRSQESQLNYVLPDGQIGTVQLIAENPCGSDTTSQSFFFSNLDEAIVSDLSVFPNPASNSISIQGSYPIRSVVLWNAVGKRMWQHPLNGLSHAQFDVSNLPPGPYQLQVKYEGRSVLRKIIIE